jgi:hypothetical protein
MLMQRLMLSLLASSGVLRIEGADHRGLIKSNGKVYHPRGAPLPARQPAMLRPSNNPLSIHLDPRPEFTSSVGPHYYMRRPAGKGYQMTYVPASSVMP